MNSNPAKQILGDMEVLYKTTMELYENYFKMLEVTIQNTPDTEADKLNELNAMVKAAEEALQADMAVFDKAVATDTESLADMQNELKIQSIYKKLQK